jgi:hypothetical protein
MNNPEIEYVIAKDKSHLVELQTKINAQYSELNTVTVFGQILEKTIVGGIIRYI